MSAPGVFVISLDTELIWGSFDHIAPQSFAARYPNVRGTIRRLIELFERHDVPATWAVVGHLFLGSCARGADGHPHPECVRPRHRWFAGDWLGLDPCTDRLTDPLWYGDDIVDWLLAARTPQEIGSHSFSHVIFGDRGCSADVARSELRACAEQALRRGITLKSFVFPRNSEGHHELLREFGITAFRGQDPTWYRQFPRAPRRIAHLLDQAVAVAPPVSQPSERLPGLWNIPGSMLWMYREGARRFVPLASRVRKAKRGLRRASEQGAVFHLWCHPFQLSIDRDAMMGALDDVLSEAVRMRARGELEILTMGGLAAQLDSRRVSRAGS
jgi:hypothetical protein